MYIEGNRHQVGLPLAASIVLLLCLPDNGSATDAPILDILAPILAAAEPQPAASARPVELSEVPLLGLLDYADRNDLTLFEIFDDIAILLDELRIRVAIRGETLRSAGQQYRYGKRRVEGLFPTDRIASVEFGHPISGGPQLEIALFEEAPSFRDENFVIGLSDSYGFQRVDRERYDGGFGITVNRFVFRFDVDRIEIYDANRIAIYTSGIGRPKRWRIAPIRRLEESEDNNPK